MTTLGWWVLDAYEVSPVWLVSWVFWVIVSIVLHELSHGWTAIALGDNTPIARGHMTWNPMVHMGPMSLVAFALVGIAWGAMPVDPTRLRGRFGDALVSLAGPGMNLALWIVTVLAAAAWQVFGPRTANPTFYENFSMFLLCGGMLNLALMLFNLVPIPPLDGFRVLASISRGLHELAQSNTGQSIGLIAFMALFYFGGGFLFSTAADVTLRVIGVLVGLAP